MIKLLIIDDEALTREGLVNFIPWKELGVDVVREADGGIEALKLAAELEPDLVLCDIKMPDMNGIEVASRINELLPACKIIFLSGYADKQHLKSAIQLRAIDFLEKPVNREELKLTVKQTVELIKQELQKAADELELKQKYAGNALAAQDMPAIKLIRKQLSQEELIQLSMDAKLNIPLVGQFMTAIIKISIEGKHPLLQLDYDERTILHVISEIFEDDSVKVIAGFKNKDQIVVHFIAEQIDYYIFNLNVIQELRAGIKEAIFRELTIFIGAGRKVNKITDIMNSYNDATLALKKQFFIGNNAMVLYTGHSPKKYSFDESIRDTFLQLLKKHNKTAIISLIKEMTDDIKRCEDSEINEIKNIYFNLLLVLLKFNEDMNFQTTEQVKDKAFFWQFVSQSTTIDEIVSYVMDQIHVIFEYLDKVNQVGQNVLTIIKYIDDNFADEEFSIKAVAEHTYLTSTYVCLIFKNKMGKTINQYLTEIRIAKAKEYLADKNMKLYEVGRRVGYLNTNHFTKTFRKVVGINPSIYRERNLDDK